MFDQIGRIIHLDEHGIQCKLLYGEQTGNCYRTTPEGEAQGQLIACVNQVNLSLIQKVYCR